MNEEVYETNSFEETQSLGEKIAKRLQGGDIVALHGNLGGGKTTFVQGLAKGLGIDKRIISPTFIIMRQYEATSPNHESRIKNLHHLDLYRLENKKEIQELGIEELFNSTQNVTVIEWAEKLGELLPKKRTEIYFEIVDENKRKIRIKYV